MIPEKLKDTTTLVKNHTMKTYIFCILLRCTIGILVINKKIPIKFLQIFAILVISTFFYKYFKLQQIWKNYLRTVLVYSLILFLITYYGDKFIEICGALIIIDALMGQQTYHIFNQIGNLIK
jgi:hypothetical protein